MNEPFVRCSYFHLAHSLQAIKTFIHITFVSLRSRTAIDESGILPNLKIKTILIGTGKMTTLLIKKM